MKLPSVYLLASAFSSLSSVKESFGKRKLSESFDVRAQVIEEAKKNYEHITGRYDSITTVPSKELYNVNSETDEELVELAGATKVDGKWLAPEGSWPSDLDPYGKPLPPDLIDKEARLTRTKDGLSVEAYKLPSDELKGPDSTALPLMYAALPVIGMIAFIMAKIWLPLGILTGLMVVPYLKAIALSEQVKEAGKAFVMLFLVPLIVAQGGSGILGALIPQAAGTFGLLVPIAIGLLLAIIATIAFYDEDNEGSFIGGAWEGFLHALKWMLIYAVAIYFIFKLGQWELELAQPAVAFALCCLYPMVYSEREGIKRAKILAVHSLMFNQATQGALNDAHLIAKREQAKRAAFDDSPLYEIGTATGELSKKEYGHAPDKGSKPCLSRNDTHMHEIVFGGSGSGKTASYARPRALAVSKLAGAVGAYIDDGKKSLVNELKGLMDIVIEPGVSFAYCEGLNAQELARALNRKSKKAGSDDKNSFFVKGGEAIIEHSCVLLEAFKDHERAQRCHAIDQMRLIHPLIDSLKLQVVSSTEDDLATLSLKAELAELEKRFTDWKEIALRPYRWYWNIKSVQEVCILFNQVKELSDGTSTASEELVEWIAYLGHGFDEESVATKVSFIHPEIGMGGILDNTIQFALKEFPQIPGVTRGGQYGNAIQSISPLMRNPALVNEEGIPWHTLETGLQVELALYGYMVGPNLPESDDGGSSLIVSSLCKMRLYKQIQARLRMKKHEWEAMGQKPLQIIWDECQDLIGDDDMELLPKARSGGVSFLFLTQGFDSLVTAFGNKDVAANFANTCASFACLRASPETYEYLSRRLGTALMTTFKEPTQGIDFDGAVRKYMNSAFNDVNHPNRQHLRRLEKQGSARFIVGRRRHHLSFGTKEESMDQSDINKGIVVNIGGAKEIQPIFKPEEFSAYLAASGFGIVHLHRAGAPRTDLVKFSYIDPDDKRLSKKST